MSRHRGPVSDHFDGERFHNAERFGKSAAELLRWRMSRKRGVWTRDLRPHGQPPPPDRVGEGALRATWVNQATVLLQVDGLNLLTDPVWSERASPVQWAGPQRFRAPGIPFEQLPKIDVVVVSHNHYDHMDADSLRRLWREHDPQFVCALGDGAHLRDWGLSKIVELDWDQCWTLPNGRRITAERAQHWSGRVGYDANVTLWMSCVIETAAGPVYFAGDSGYGPHFADIRRRHGAMRLALLPIGAYLPRWFMAYQHMDPAEAVQAHLDLGSAFSLGIHYGSFELADDGQDEAVTDLLKALAARSIDATHFPPAAFGAGYDVAAL
ncbi:MAG TPA: MBL fold metallo-hydrolase [Solimonas sp.]|nr:MBL fold metallo-hydrolase [Solimonas sp.]